MKNKITAVKNKTGSMVLMPAAPGTCQECATKHEPKMPHNQQSLFWLVRFKMKHGRTPTWKDAMAHCASEMRSAWIDELLKRGVKVPA